MRRCLHSGEVCNEARSAMRRGLQGGEVYVVGSAFRQGLNGGEACIAAKKVNGS